MALLYSRADVNRLYYGTDTRAQSLLVGAALAVGLSLWAERRGRSTDGGTAWAAPSARRPSGGTGDRPGRGGRERAAVDARSPTTTPSPTGGASCWPRWPRRPSFSAWSRRTLPAGGMPVGGAPALRRAHLLRDVPLALPALHLPRQRPHRRSPGTRCSRCASRPPWSSPRSPSTWSSARSGKGISCRAGGPGWSPRVAVAATSIALVGGHRRPLGGVGQSGPAPVPSKRPAGPPRQGAAGRRFHRTHPGHRAERARQRLRRQAVRRGHPGLRRHERGASSSSRAWTLADGGPVQRRTPGPTMAADLATRHRPGPPERGDDPGRSVGGGQPHLPGTLDQHREPPSTPPTSSGSSSEPCTSPAPGGHTWC